MTTETREALERWRRHKAAMEIGDIKASPYYGHKPQHSSKCGINMRLMQDDEHKISTLASRIVAELEEWRERLNVNIKQFHLKSHEPAHFTVTKITAILEGK